jgi:hypothetical protein
MPAIKRQGKTLKSSEIALLIQEAEGWKPEKGDEIQGTVLGAKLSSGGDFGPYPILFVLQDDEPVAVHAFHTVLRNELVSQRPQSGEIIYIRYLGPDTKYDGPRNAPEMYAVFVERPGEQSTAIWDALSSSEPTRNPANFEDQPPF